jgi:putative oxidoreductase
MLRSLLKTHNSAVLTVGRLILGVVFFAHGAQKALGWFGGGGFSATMSGFEHNFPAPLAFLAIMAEFLGGIGLLLGLLGRVAAFGITCNMLVAIATVHAKNGFFMNWGGHQKGEGFEFHLIVLALTIGIMIGGSGAWSVDQAWYRAIARGKQPELVARPGTA